MNLARHLVFPATRNGPRNDEFSHIPDLGSVAPGRCCILCSYRGGCRMPHPGRVDAVVRCPRLYARSAPSFPPRRRQLNLPATFLEMAVAACILFILATGFGWTASSLFRCCRSDPASRRAGVIAPCPAIQGVTRRARYRIPYNDSFRRSVLTPIPRILAAQTLFLPLCS